MSNRTVGPHFLSMMTSSENITFLCAFAMLFFDYVFSNLYKLSLISSNYFVYEKFMSFSYLDCKF